MDMVQAGSSNVALTVEFFNNAGAAVTPSSASYKTLGREIGGSWQELRALTAISSLSTSVDIALDSTDTDMIGSGNLEDRRVCVYVDSAYWTSFTFNVESTECV